MKPSQEFFDEFEPLKERIAWAQAGLGTEKQIAQGKMMIEEFREFFRKWRPQVAGHPDTRRRLDDLQKSFDKMEKHLQQLFWLHLNTVVAARQDWINQEAMFGAMVAVLKLRKEMPEQLREGFEKILRDYSEGEFDAEKAFREAERDAAAAETKFRQALAGLEIDWPERVDAALRERLEKLDAEGAKAWQAQIGSQVEKLAGEAAD